MPSHRSLRVGGVCVCLLVFASIVWSMSHWSEARGVFDDICYLRQAHLFQRFGLNGIDTNLARDDDGYMVGKMKQIGLLDQIAPCHTSMPAEHKSVLQYPPGTGFALSFFPEGFQVVPLYVVATTLVLLFALAAIFLAGNPSGIVMASAFGCTALYFMINPAKASYSVAPTMVLCVTAGLLTALLFRFRQLRARLLTTFSLGLLLGIAVNFRLPNLFLSLGYCAFFLAVFLISRRLEALLQGFLFGAALLIGMIPTLCANAVNAGSPLSTTYGPADAAPMDFSFKIVRYYLSDLQGFLLILAAAWCAAVITRRTGGTRALACIVAANLAISATYFMTHAIFTQYYLFPLAMLSLWSLLFDRLLQTAAISPVGMPPNIGRETAEPATKAAL